MTHNIIVTPIQDQHQIASYIQEVQNAPHTYLHLDYASVHSIIVDDEKAYVDNPANPRIIHEKDVVCRIGDLHVRSDKGLSIFVTDKDLKRLISSGNYSPLPSRMLDDA
jgi:hypothetical protein